MKEIFDESLKERYLKKYQIEKIFDTPNLEFHLFCYEAGESMSSLRSPSRYLKFIVDGKWDIYSVNEEGKIYLIKHADNFSIMGDIEFFSGIETGNIQEVKESVYSLELSLEKYRKVLLEDNAFLRFLCRNMTQKLLGSFIETANHATLEEQLLQYMRYECEDGRITNIEEAAFRLNHSRRQLQRVLKKLVSENVLEKERRGTYRLLQAYTTKKL